MENKERLASQNIFSLLSGEHKNYPTKESFSKEIEKFLISIDQVRLIGTEGQELGVVSVSDARKMSGNLGLDLVPLNLKATPPVFKIMGLDNFLYDMGKKSLRN